MTTNRYGGRPIGAPKGRAPKPEPGSIFRPITRRRPQLVDPEPRVRHGLRPEEVTLMLSAQGGLCLICRRPIDARTLRIDHDHELAQAHGHSRAEGCRLCVRGLLCGDCNTMLGAGRDDPETLRRGAAYVEAARERAL